MSTNMETATEANRLYWETETSVGDIAQRLELSRRALYDALQPIPTGARCAACGGTMVFENRSARTGNHAICSECGKQPAIEPPAEPATVTESASRSVIDEQTLRLVGAMVVGALAGAVVTLTAVRRR